MRSHLLPSRVSVTLFLFIFCQISCGIPQLASARLLKALAATYHTSCPQRNWVVVTTKKILWILTAFSSSEIVTTSEMHRLKSTDFLPTVECPCVCVFLQDLHIALIVWKMPSHVSKELGTTYVYIYIHMHYYNTNILHKISGFVMFPRKSNSCCDASIMGSQASRYEVQSVYTGVKHLKGVKPRGG